MKKFSILIICLALLLTLASCKGSSNSGSTTTKPQGSQEQTADVNKFLSENSNLPALPGQSKSSISLDGFAGEGNTYTDSARGICYIFKGEKLQSVKISSKNFAIMGITVGDELQMASFMLQGSGFTADNEMRYFSMGNVVIEVTESNGTVAEFTLSLKER